MGNIEKEKRVYFLFSKIYSENQDKIIYNMVIDYFIHNTNNYSTFMDISHQFIIDRKIKFSPETIQQNLLELNYSEIFENLDPNKGIDEPFKLKSDVYDTLLSYTNYIDELYKYVDQFLKCHNYKAKYRDLIINLLLEIIFKRNIQYLKKIITAREEKNIKEELHFNNDNKQPNSDKKICSYYNEMIENSGSDFDEILRMIVLKMFDFLSLNYNPHHKQSLEQRFGGKIFYLDSSFILRLLGFDSKIRENRSVELISLLKEIKDVEFYVHRETISEAQFRIKELINYSLPIIQHQEKIVKSILEHIPDKKSGVVDLYFRLKSEGKISNTRDFLLFFSNITSKLRQILGYDSFRIDDKKIKTDNTKKQKLKELLAKTDKTKNRIRHIVRIISHLDNLREANNYNPFDIKYWLVTTDNKTLQIDHELCESSEDAVKSACILPTELIRMIDGFGNITSEHINVFKKFILSSHIFSNDYTDEDIQTIDKISSMIENVDIENYDTDELINNLFEKISYEDIQKRLSTIKNEEEKNAALIEMFNDANEAYIENKYTNIIKSLRKSYKIQGNIIFFIFVFLLPCLATFYILYNIINPNLLWSDPKTYILKNEWDILNGVISFVDIVFWGLAICLYKKFKNKFVDWYVNLLIRKHI